VEKVVADDPAMLKAFAKAAATLDGFLAHLAAKDPGLAEPVLKVKIADGNAVEYFWVVDIQKVPAGFSGTINNDPELVSNVHNGQAITFERSQIYDWSYQDAKTGRMVGNFTACALLKHKPAQEAAEFKRTYHLQCDS
jgi:uncharacterized protein YegJ (DUF2314 family)